MYICIPCHTVTEGVVFDRAENQMRVQFKQVKDMYSRSMIANRST